MQRTIERLLTQKLASIFLYTFVKVEGELLRVPSSVKEINDWEHNSQMVIEMKANVVNYYLVSISNYTFLSHSVM